MNRGQLIARKMLTTGDPLCDTIAGLLDEVKAAIEKEATSPAQIAASHSETERIWNAAYMRLREKLLDHRDHPQTEAVMQILTDNLLDVEKRFANATPVEALDAVHNVGQFVLGLEKLGTAEINKIVKSTMEELEESEIPGEPLGGGLG